MIVIPMAGQSSRFAKAGYGRPKYMLKVGSRSLFRHAVESFSAYFENFPFLFIYRDIDGTDGFLRSEVKALGIREAQFIALDDPTGGQAETVAFGLKRAKVIGNDPLTIFNIDTIRPGFTFPDAPALATCDGWLEVFRGQGENWSFVKPRSAVDTAVSFVTEKQPISDLCCTGLYHFARSEDFSDAFYAERADGPSQAAEFYVAPLYNRLIANGMDIRYNLIVSDAVTFSGVPEEYEELVRRHG